MRMPHLRQVPLGPDALPGKFCNRSSWFNKEEEAMATEVGCIVCIFCVSNLYTNRIYFMCWAYSYHVLRSIFQ